MSRHGFCLTHPQFPGTSGFFDNLAAPSQICQQAVVSPLFPPCTAISALLTSSPRRRGSILIGQVNDGPVPLDSRRRGNDENDRFLARKGRKTSIVLLENWRSLRVLPTSLTVVNGMW